MNDTCGPVDRWQIDDAETVIRVGLGRYRHSGVHHDCAVAGRSVLVVGQRRAGRSEACAGDLMPQLVVERLDDWRDCGWLEARCHAGELAYPDPWDAPGNDSVSRRVGLVLDAEQSRFDAGKSRCLRLDLSADLGPAQPEHAAKLSRSEFLF